MRLKLFIRMKLAWQTLTRGFSDHDIYRLDITIVKFILPRLKYFVQHSVGHIPVTLLEKEDYPSIEVATKLWEEILGLMIRGLEIYQAQKELDQQRVFDLMCAYELKSEKELTQARKQGLMLLAIYIGDLWV